jgi:hypothetical protein
MTMTISGSGSVTGLTAGGLPDASVQQADLAANVAGNGPAFSAYQSVAQSLPNNSFGKLQLQTKEFDTAGAFDSTTNYRFQPTVAGYYHVVGALTVAITTANFLSVAVYKNGASFKRGSQSKTSGAGTQVVSCLVFLNGSTDYVELFGNQDSGAATNSQAGVDFTYFQGYLARSA